MAVNVTLISALNSNTHRYCPPPLPTLYPPLHGTAMHFPHRARQPSQRPHRLMYHSMAANLAGIGPYHSPRLPPPPPPPVVTGPRPRYCADCCPSTRGMGEKRRRKWMRDVPDTRHLRSDGNMMEAWRRGWERGLMSIR